MCRCVLSYGILVYKQPQVTQINLYQDQITATRAAIKRDRDTVRSRYIAVIFLLISHGIHPMATGEVWGVIREFIVWPNSYLCNCCSVCNIALWMTAMRYIVSA